MTRRLILVGAGGHAKVVADAALAQRDFELAVVCSDLSEDFGRKFFSVQVSGPIEQQFEMWVGEEVAVHVAIGNNLARRKLANAARRFGFQLATIQHPSAWVSPSARISDGVYIGAQAAVNAFSRVAPGAIINTAAIVEHDCSIGEFSHVGPGACVTGNCSVGAQAFMGARSVVIPGRSIGLRSTVGAGAVVTRDVPPGEAVKGVPARSRPLPS